MNIEDATTRMLTGLLDESHLSRLEQLPDLINRHARGAGLAQVLIYLVDMQQKVLRLVDAAGDRPGDLAAGNDGQLRGRSPDPDAPGELRVDGTLGGRAFQEVRILAKTGAGDRVAHWWVPLLEGTERLGVLRVTPATSRPAAGPAGLELLRRLASIIALMLVSKRAYSDCYARIVRTRPMNVAAEMQWNLIPPLTFADREVTISAVMEPAYEIGGDAFDYATVGDTVHLAVFDAMGHDLSAGLAANLAISAYRSNRRAGADLTASSEAIEAALMEEFGDANRFVTAILADLHIKTGTFTWVNRGHHPPVLIRRGRWIISLRCPPAHPMGTALAIPVTLCREQLEPGDRVLLYTDGISEMRDARGREFGLERFVDFVIRQSASGLPVPEILRRLIRTLMDYYDGRLRDDATVLLVEWHGSAHRRLQV